MRTRLALFVALTLSLACDDESPTAPGDVSISFETIVQASYSGFSEPRRAVVHDEGDLARVWQTLHAGQSPVPALPAVDFESETVMLAAAGSRSNGCYSIEITRADLSADGALETEVTETVPGPACVCTQAITQPAHLVRVGLPSAGAVFIDRIVQSSC